MELSGVELYRERPTLAAAAAAVAVGCSTLLRVYDAHRAREREVRQNRRLPAHSDLSIRPNGLPRADEFSERAASACRDSHEAALLRRRHESVGARVELYAPAMIGGIHYYKE